jgi:hypothetical protein
MARKRASIKGKGVDILFGEKAPSKKPDLEIEREVDIEELLGEEAGLAEPELNADLEKAFGEEVMAMEPVPPTPVTPAEELAPPEAPPSAPVTPMEEPAPPWAPPSVPATPVEEPAPPWAPPSVPATPMEEPAPPWAPPSVPATPVEEPGPPKAREVVSPPLEVPPSSEPRKVSVTLKVEEPSPPPAAPAPRVVEEAPPIPTRPPVTPEPTVEVPSPPEKPARRLEEAAYGPPPRVAEPALAEATPAAPPERPPVSPYDRPSPEIKPGGYLLEHPVAIGEEAGLPTGVVPREEQVEAKRAEEIPPQISQEVSERTVLNRLGEERQEALFKEIDTLVVKAAQVLSVDKGLDEALSLLREARDISIERPRQFDQAEYRVAKVRAMLERKQNISRWSLIYGYPVLLYEVVWFLLLLGSLLFDHSLAAFIANVTGGVSSDLGSLSMEHIFPLWNTMAWGGIGGVVGSLYSLYWHAAVEQDFDRQYVMWYIVQPIMGVILGGIVYLIIASGFISIQVLAAQASTVSEAAQSMANPAVKAFHSAVAVVAGFRQRFVFELLDKIVQVLTPKPKTKAEREAEETEKKKTS